MTEINNKDWEEWESLDIEKYSKRLKMPVSFLREKVETPEMIMLDSEPKKKNIASTIPIVVNNKKNKNKLF